MADSRQTSARGTDPDQRGLGPREPPPAPPPPRDPRPKLRMPISPELKSQNDLRLAPGQTLTIERKSFKELGVQPVGEHEGFERYKIVDEKGVIQRHYIKWLNKSAPDVVAVPPEPPPLPGQTTDTLAPPPYPLMPITPEQRGLTRRRPTIKMPPHQYMRMQPEQVFVSKKALEIEQQAIRQSEIGATLPGDSKVGGAIDVVSFILDIIGEFGGHGAGRVSGYVVPVGVIISIGSGFKDAARANNATAELTILVATAFATTAWLYQHGYPRIPPELMKNAKLEKHRKAIQKSWREAIRKRNQELNTWLTEIYANSYSLCIKSGVHPLNIPSKPRILHILRQKVGKKPADFTREMLLHKDIVGQLTRVEKRLWPMHWARIPYRR